MDLGIETLQINTNYKKHYNVESRNVLLSTVNMSITVKGDAVFAQWLGK